MAGTFLKLDRRWWALSVGLWAQPGGQVSDWHSLNGLARARRMMCICLKDPFGVDGVVGFYRYCS